jgi:biopolymer transport protein ExbD
VAPVTDFAGLNLGVVSVGPAPDPKVKPKTLKICLEQSGDVRVADKTLNNRNELVQTIQNDLPNFPDGVIIEVDPETNQDFLAFVMNAVGKAGVKTKVALRELKTDTKKKP